MWSLTAHDEETLRDISDAVHDAYIYGDVEFDPSSGTVYVPLVQEGWADGAPETREFVRETWRYRENRITFFRGRLIIRHVRGLEGLDEWDGPMIESVSYQQSSGEVHVTADDPLRVMVDGLDVTVEISTDVHGHVRRRTAKFTGVVRDTWLDQRP